MQEFPTIPKTWKKNIKKIAIVYPNLYYGGVYCLGPLIVYNIINQQKDWLCERIFLDKGDLKQHNFIGFTLQYELDYYNFIEILKKNNIPLSKDRKQIIFAGGPCINANYKVLSKYIDFFILGDVEETIVKVLKHYTEDKQTFLNKIKNIPGVTINKESFSPLVDLDKIPYPLYQPLPETLTKNFVFGKAFLLEIERGCPFDCKFCALSAIYKKVRYRSLEKIKEIIDQGTSLNKRNKVVIYSASFTHPKRKEILKYLIKKDLQFSVPSLRANIIDEELLSLIEQGKQKTITLSPECNETLRFKVGKEIKDEIYFKVAKTLNKFNFSALKLYFMIGIPNQTEKDLKEMIEFIKKIKKIYKNVHISINPFVPKPKTKFEKHKFDKKTIKQQINYIKKELNKIKVKYKISNLNTSYLEWKLARDFS